MKKDALSKLYKNNKTALNVLIILDIIIFIFCGTVCMLYNISKETKKARKLLFNDEIGNYVIAGILVVFAAVLIFQIILLLVLMFSKDGKKYGSVSRILNVTGKIGDNKLISKIQTFKAPYILMIGMFVLTVVILYRHCDGSVKGSDFYIHTTFAMKMRFPYITKQQHFLWHLGTRILYLIGVSRIWAPLIFTGIVNVFNYYITYKILRKTCKNHILCSVFAFIAMVVYAIRVPSINPLIYMSSGGSPNYWHNPTNQMVRPLGLLAFYLFVDIFDNCKNDAFFAKGSRKLRTKVILFSFMLLLTVLAKPSFVQAFLPGLAVFLLIDLIKTKGKSFPFCFMIGVAVIPCFLIVIYQMTGLWFHSGSSGGAAGSSASKNASHIFISFLYTTGGFGLKPIWMYFIKQLLMMAFPVYVFVLSGKKLKNSTEGKLSLWFFAFSIAENMCMFESGARLNDGNFAWAKLLAAYSVWIVALRWFMEMLESWNESKKDFFKVLVGGLILSFHIISGISYIVLQLTGVLWV